MGNWKMEAASGRNSLNTDHGFLLLSAITVKYGICESRRIAKPILNSNNFLGQNKAYRKFSGPEKCSVFYPKQA